MTPVPCGKCIPCLKRRSSQWSFRLLQEQKYSLTSTFLTLTYAKAPLTKNNLPTLIKSDYQKFFKRLRKLAPELKGKNRLKYFACGEYGTLTQRPHYHAIAFNLPQKLINDSTIIRDTWKHGHVQVANSNAKTINYTVGYILKGGKPELIDKVNGIYDDRSPEFQLMSKGLGSNYLTPQMKKYYRDRQLPCIIHEDGHLLSMPRYYKNILYKPHEQKEMYREFIKIQSMKHEDFLYSWNLDGKTKKDIWLDNERKRDKQFKLKRALI